MIPMGPTPAPEPVDELGIVRRDLSAAIMAENWEAVRAIEARLAQLDDDGAPKGVSVLVRDACRKHGTLAVSEAFGFSRQAILAVAADVPSLAVLIAVQGRLASALADLEARAERRETRRAKADASRDIVEGARDEKATKNGTAKP
jgi:hypothetical protein